PKVIAALVGAVIVLAGLMWLLIYNLAFKNKKQPENVMMPTINLAAGAGETELFGYGTGSQNNGTEQLTPSVSDGRKKYMFLMTDTEDEDRSFRCELIDEVTIGRMEDNYIIIGDDNSVHRHHSVVSVKNGTFYYTDLKDVKNRSAINGVLLKPTIPQLIVSNSVVTIGRHSYTITISEGR
ncbi:MAG: FHA domain-containing protein, partial [Solobacterium sp.]|nr:FHA domain-containing protein [Solobacterium sp.]